MTLQEQYRMRIFISLVLSTILIVLMLVLVFLVFKGFDATVTKLVLAGLVLVLFLLSFASCQLYKNCAFVVKSEDSQQNIINALCSVYENVYVLNTKTHALSICKLSSVIDKKYREAFGGIKYEDAFQIYAENDVYDEDRPIFDSISDVDSILSLVGDETTNSFIYRIIRDDEIHFEQCFVFSANLNSDEIILAFKGVDEMISEKLMAERKLTESHENQILQLNLISSISSIYLTVHLVDLKADMVAEINTSEQVRKFVHQNTDAAKQMHDVMVYTVVPEYLDNALEFTDFSTLSERLKGKKSISQEFEGKFRGWFRASFITVESEKDGTPTKVLFTTQLIDDEKRKEELLLSKANTDGLTHILNRNAYSEEVEKYSSGPIPHDIVIVSMDVNGLKNMNDTFGHAAGDELICGAASCITNAFSKYGKVYRTGGDEFQAIIFSGSRKLAEIMADFSEMLRDWSGKYVQELSISTGYVSRADKPELSFSEMLRLADQRMYSEKEEFYKKRGINRRSQQAASDALFCSYEKILEIDLDTQKFMFIHPHFENGNPFLNFDEISHVFEFLKKAGDFLLTDEEKVGKCLDIDYLRAYFSSGKKNFSIHYKKKIGGAFQNMLMEIIAASEYSTENQIVFLYIKNIEKQDW